MGISFPGKKRYEGVRFNVISITRGWMGVKFPGKKRYDGVRFNVISITRGWVGVKFPGKKRYVTLEWPPTACLQECRF